MKLEKEETIQKAIDHVYDILFEFVCEYEEIIQKAIDHVYDILFEFVCEYGDGEIYDLLIEYKDMHDGVTIRRSWKDREERLTPSNSME